LFFDKGILEKDKKQEKAFCKAIGKYRGQYDFPTVGLSLFSLIHFFTVA
jgi:hypothetical protein